MYTFFLILTTLNSNSKKNPVELLSRRTFDPKARYHLHRESVSNKQMHKENADGIQSVRLELTLLYIFISQTTILSYFSE